MTWGRKYGGQQCIDGYCSVNFIDYAHMQDSLAAAYLFMSNDLQTPVAPVGMAWKKSIVEHDDPVELFASDASHPTLAGSYLAACTYYAAIFHKSPVGLSFNAGLNNETATYLQTIASETVFDNLDIWNIDTTTVVSAFDYSQDEGIVRFNNLLVNADTYLWDFGNGDSDIIINPVYQYTQSGTYQVMLRSSFNCKVDIVYDTIQIVISSNVDVKPEYINFYPNPVKGNFYFENYSLNVEAQIRITNIFGNIVSYAEKKISTRDVKIILNPDLKKGVYFCSIKTMDKYFVGKIVVWEY